MGILTWQNVPVGDLGASQESFRNASAMLDRATRSGQEGAAALQSIFDSRQAFAQQTADKVLAAKMMAIQDPAQYRAAMASGAMAPAGASLDAMMRANKQLDLIQARTQADQTLLNTKQEFETGKQKLADLVYASNRNQLLNKQNDAIAPMITQYSDIAVRDPKAAMQAFEADMAKQGLAIDATTAQAVAEGFRKLYIPPDHDGRRAWREEKINKGIADFLLNAANAGTEGFDQKKFIEDTWENKTYGDETSEVIVKAQAILEGKDPGYHGTVTSYKADLGVKPTGRTNMPGYEAVNAFDNDMAKAENSLTTGARAAVAAEEVDKAGAGKTTASVAQHLSKEYSALFGKDADMAQAKEFMDELRTENPNITPSQAGMLLLTGLQSSGGLRISNIAKNLDIRKGFVSDMAKSFSLSTTEREQYKKAQDANTELQAAKNQYISTENEIRALEKRIEAKGSASPGDEAKLEKLNNTLESLGKEISTPLAKAKEMAARSISTSALAAQGVAVPKVWDVAATPGFWDRVQSAGNPELSMNQFDRVKAQMAAKAQEEALRQPIPSLPPMPITPEQRAAAAAGAAQNAAWERQFGPLEVARGPAPSRVTAEDIAKFSKPGIQVDLDSRSKKSNSGDVNLDDEEPVDQKPIGTRLRSADLTTTKFDTKSEKPKGKRGGKRRPHREKDNTEE